MFEWDALSKSAQRSGETQGNEASAAPWR